MVGRSENQSLIHKKEVVNMKAIINKLLNEGSL